MTLSRADRARGTLRGLGRLRADARKRLELTEGRARKELARAVELGVSQREAAALLGIAHTTAAVWLRQEKGDRDG